MPFHDPIVSHEQATATMREMHRWHAASEEEAEESGDRVIEVMVYRSVKLWLDTQGPGVGLHTAEPIFVAPPHDVKILAPALYLSDLAARAPYEQLRQGASFFDNATCLNLLGSEQAGTLFRDAMYGRFGMPQDACPINRSCKPWPRPPLWRGVDAVLAVMMTSEHRMRREAGLLRLSTNAAPGASRPRRL